MINPTPNPASRPFLDKGETTGGTRGRIDANKKRLSRRAFLRRQNLRLAESLEMELHRIEAEHDERPRIRKLIANLRGCSSKSLFRQFNQGGAVSFIGSHTCKNKLCQICNSERKRKVRSKYYRYFLDNPSMREDYDFMHLTLSVPHTKKGWRGKRVYVNEIGKQFNLMRKDATWKMFVHGGELNVEFTENDDGLHIHIHALCMVHKVRGSRNLLYQYILRRWNALTIDPGARRQKFTDNQRDGLRASLANLSDTDFDRLMGELDPRGATMIGLESLYVLSDKKKRGYRWCDRAQAWKRYIRTDSEKDFMSGLMECLKYHFEPVVFSKEYTTPEGRKERFWDVDLIFEVAPLIYRKPLYRKFGGLYGVKELNINEAKTAAEEIDEILEDDGHDLIIHPETEEVMEREEYQFIMCDLSVAFIHGKTRRMEIRGPCQTIPVRTVKEAYIILIHPDRLMDLKRVSNSNSQ